jgi:drug/metabolite transporter (DMT)-like permease
MTRASLLDGSETDRPGLAAALMLAALLTLALQDSFVRMAGADTTLWQFQAVRSIGNVALLLLVARLVWGTAPKRPKRMWAVVVRSLLLLTSTLLYFGGVPTLTMAEMGAGLYTFPVFVTILSVIVLREHVGLWRAGAVLAGATGAWLILQPDSAGFTWLKLMPVGAGLTYAGVVIVTRRYCRQESPVTLAFGVGISYVAAGLAGMLALALFPASPEAQAELPYLARGWVPIGWGVLGLAALCSILNVSANLGLTMAYQNAESSWLAPFDYSYLVFVTFWGFVIFADFPDASMLAGMALIAAAGTLTAWRERQQSRALAAPPR